MSFSQVEGDYMSDKSLRKSLIRLAYNNPELRSKILPILSRKSAGSDLVASSKMRLAASKYLDDYLDANEKAGRGKGKTPGSYLSTVLKGKAKQYSGGYLKALINALQAAVRKGDVEEDVSVGKQTAYYWAD